MRAAKSKVFLMAALPFFGVGAAPVPAPPRAELVEVRQLQMGVMATISVYAADPAAARAACARAFARVRELNDVFSDYDPASELRRLVARAGAGPVPVSAELFAMLDFAKTFAARSGYRLDPTVGPLVQAWREARRLKRMPAPDALAAARALVGAERLRLDPATRTAELALPGMKLDLGAFAKGYAGDEALRVLREAGFPAAMIEAGGDMVFGDPPPGTDGWPVVEPGRPGATNRLARCALSASGDTVQFVEIEGRRYSHVVDPATGLGLTNRLMCVVRAPRGLWSDALSTAGTLMPEPAFRAMIERHFPGAEARVLPAPAGEP